MQIRLDHLQIESLTLDTAPFFGGNLVTWESKKKNVIAWSSVEAKYKTMAHAARELACLQHFLQELGFSIPTHITQSCDNKTAIHIASNPVFHEDQAY